MIVHTIPEAFFDTYPTVCDWIDARFPESVPAGRYVRHVNTRIDHPDYELRDLENWVADSPLIRPEVLVDLPAEYGFTPAFYQGSLHAPVHVVFADDMAEMAADFEAAFLS